MLSTKVLLFSAKSISGSELFCFLSGFLAYKYLLASLLR